MVETKCGPAHSTRVSKQQLTKNCDGQWLTRLSSSLVFIHGITGSREGTWTAAGGETPWPKSFIPPLLPNVRILGFGYAADVTHWWKMADQGTVYGYGQSLMNSLYAHRSLDGSVSGSLPIINGPLIRHTNL